jgi:hypothetical protein
MTSVPNKVNFRYLFKDIVYGFSEVELDGRTFYIKHLSSLDQVDLEELEEDFFNEAHRRGLPTEEETLERLRDEEMWTTGDDAEITKQESYLKNLETTQKELYLKTLIEDNLAEQKKAKKKLSELLSAKNNLIGQTCEIHSKSRTSDHFILKSFYEDRTLHTPYFSEEKIDELGRDELLQIVIAYNSKILRLSDKNIQKIVLQDFYSAYFPFSDNVMNFYDKPLFELSLHQVKLIVFTRMFKNIFEGYPKMPETIKKDPEKIISYVNAQDKAKDVVSNLDKEGASTIVGAKPEDYEYLGYKQTPKGASLSEQLKKKGGRMNMKDLIETMG